MAKAKGYKPRSFESVGVKNGKNDTYAAIYKSMLFCPAFKNLKNRTIILYLYMKEKHYGHRKPSADFPNIPALQGNELFYFPFSAAVETGVYTKNMKREFYNDVKELEEHGFIRTVFNGKSRKQKSIYEFSNKWQEWKDK